jgi:hypothetical protein
MAQVVELLLCKYEIRSSNPSSTKKEKKNGATSSVIREKQIKITIREVGTSDSHL